MMIGIVVIVAVFIIGILLSNKHDNKIKKADFPVDKIEYFTYDIFIRVYTEVDSTSVTYDKDCKCFTKTETVTEYYDIETGMTVDTNIKCDVAGIIDIHKSHHRNYNVWLIDKYHVAVMDALYPRHDDVYRRRVVPIFKLRNA